MRRLIAAPGLGGESEEGANPPALRVVECVEVAEIFRDCRGEWVD